MLSTALICAQSPTPAPFPSPPPHPADAPPGKPDNAPLSLFPLQTRWTLALNSQLAGAPAYDDAGAYFPIEGDRIVAYDAVEGRRRWMVTARPRLPLVAGGGFVFLVTADALIALRSEDGSVAWQLPFAEPVVARPVWDIGWLVVSTKDGKVLTFRGEDGHLIWSRDIGSPAHAPPALAADRIYIPAEDGRVIALQVDTGQPVWERKLGGPADDILALDDRVYVGSKDNHFYCLLASDGQVDWRWRTGGDIVGAPVVLERHVYFVALDNVLRSLDRRSGGQQWMRPLPLRPVTGPVRVGGTLVVSGVLPPLRGYNIADGVAAGDVTGGGEVAAPPHVIEAPASPAALLLFITRDIAKGATVTLVTRSFEPEPTPVAPLPNIVTFETPKR